MTFLDALGTRLLVGDGAMGTMIQAANLSADAFAGHDGCNDILNLTSPDTIRGIHSAYLDAGADWVETNTFGVNLTALTDYGLVDRTAEIAEAGARLARQAADAAATADWPRFVVGSLGPGTKLPTLGQVSFAALRDTYQTAAAGLLAGGVDAIQVETCQDLLQVKAAVIGARRAIAAAGRVLPVIVSITIEANGAMLLGTPVDAAVAALRHLGIDALGLNCATGPDLMAGPLRQLSRLCPLPVVTMPNAGLPELGPEGAVYPLTPEDFAEAMAGFAADFGVASVAGCCGTTPAHIAALRTAVPRGSLVGSRQVIAQDALSSLYEAVDVRQDVSYLAVGERANAAGSKAFREAMMAQRWDDCVDIARRQAGAGAHVVDICVDQVGSDGVADMSELVARFATAVTSPLVLDSSKPSVLLAGLERAPGRCLVNSVNLEDGDGPGSKYEQVMTAVTEHGAAVVALTIDEDGLATTRERKVAVARRLITELTTRWGLAQADIFVDLLTYPVTTGAEDARGAARDTIEALRDIKVEFPGVGTILGVSNVSFGLAPSARAVLNSVFLDECRKNGLDAAIVDAARIKPLHQIPADLAQAAQDLLWDDHTRVDDPLAAFMALSDEVAGQPPIEAAQDALAGLPVGERLVRRIVDAVPSGLEDDLDEALASRDALAVLNDDLLEGMRQVGDLFGAGKLQLPFVLASAEVMKKAVAHLEPLLAADRTDSPARGTLVLATVAGDVHDIGKNLVDIIVSNNGYKVVNLGVRVPIDRIVEAALAEDASAIGMSGLLVKSAEVMADNLTELKRRGLAERFPVVLGGAALSRRYVDSLRPGYSQVHYAADAFEGLKVLEGTRHPARSDAESQDLLEPDVRSSTGVLPRRTTLVGAWPDGHYRASRRSSQSHIGAPADRRDPLCEMCADAKPQPTPSDVPDAPTGLPRSDVTRGVAVPVPPFWGARRVEGLSLRGIEPWLDYRALLLGRWGLRTERGRAFDDLLADNRARLDGYLDRIRQDGLAQFAVAYGYWPCHSSDGDLVLLDPLSRSEIARLNFPRQARAPHLCIADYFRDEAEAATLGPDVIALQLVTMGAAASRATAGLFEQDHYREYLELHGLTVQLAEAAAEMWHARVRHELGIDGQDGTVEEILAHQRYQGERYSFGYPSCPDLEPRRVLADLVGADAIGVELTEALQLVPEQSTDALVVHHPEARYFSLH